MAVKASKDIKRTLPQPALEAALKGSGLGVRESLIEDTIDEMRVQLPMCSGLGIGLGLGLGILTLTQTLPLTLTLTLIPTVALALALALAVPLARYSAHARP